MLPWDIVRSRRVLTSCHYGILKPHDVYELYVTMGYCDITTCVTFMLIWDCETSYGGLTIYYHGIL